MIKREGAEPMAIEVRDIVKRFDGFTALDGVITSARSAASAASGGGSATAIPDLAPA